VLLMTAIIAAVLMATFNFGTGARVKYKTAYAIVMYGGLPGIISALLATVSLLAGTDPEGFDVRNPIASNPAYFMDAGGNQFAYAMASALDVFVLWNIVLMGIGFACNSKVKRSTAILIVAAWYLVYKLGGAGLAALFS
nr:YIP1 family protein [Terriglobales bacterium]